jgi:type I restriction enzyme S subunit
VGETGGHSSYDEYEDSGIDWLGEIPAHWSFERLKWTVTDCKNGYWGDPPEGDENDINTVRVADFDRFALRVPDQDFTVRSVPSEKRDGRVLKPGDLLLEKSGGGDKQPVGVVMLYDLDKPAVCSNFIARMPVAEGHDSSFLRYLHAALYEGGLNEQAIKQSIGIQNLDADQYLNLEVGLPPLDEQRAIADYLDRETGRIDALIEKKEQLIDLLEEKRTALISRVVTQSLDRDVEMQDSGVEWLGEIPAGWDIARLKFLAEIQSGIAKGKRYGDEVETVELPYLRVANVQEGFLNLDEISTIEVATDEVDRYLLKQSDVLMTEGGDFDKLGRGTVWTGEIKPCLHQNHIFAVRPREISSEWVALITQARYAKHFFIVQSVQSTNLASISMSSLQNLPVLLPPSSTRQEILYRVNKETERVDMLVDKVKEAIDRLQEYRTALISAAVTGQIDVREVARTPDVKEADTWDRMILTMELIRRMRAARHRSLGRTLLVKMLYLIQHHVQVTGMGFDYKRKDYGPYARELRYNVENALQDQGWIQVSEDGEQVQYELLEKADDETVQAYFESSWGDVGDRIDEIVSYFHQFDAERAEIVATLYAAWNDLKILGRSHDEEAVIREVQENWHPRKQEIDESRWRNALHWMRDEGLVPTGFGEPTIDREG